MFNTPILLDGDFRFWIHHPVKWGYNDISSYGLMSCYFQRHNRCSVTKCSSNIVEIVEEFPRRHTDGGVDIKIYPLFFVYVKNECLSFHSLTPVIFRDTIDAVKQSAALTLLRLLRNSPDVIQMGEWTSRIIHLLNDQHMVRKIQLLLF